jgi:hypothetical protein
MILGDKIENVINLKDIDSASAMIESSDYFLNNIQLHSDSNFLNRYNELKKKYSELTGSDEVTMKKNVESLKTRKAEVEFINESVQKNAPIVILPRQYQDLELRVKNNRELYSKFVNLVEYANASLAFMTQKGVQVKA